MMKKLYVYEGTSWDPYYNLAMEEHLLQSVKPGMCILYLWQNENTVVIGQNQNAWKECRLSLLEAENGKLARRLSGGGAVFHDLGNLNFTFLMPSEDYDLDRQLQVILEACNTLGIPAEKSGRNDILADGRKFSGNAFYRGKEKSYHHGTLLVDVDMEKLSRYLSPSKAKMEAKGVASVRSRVVNLREFCPDLTISRLKEELVQAFSRVYGGPIAPWEDVDALAVEELRRRNETWEWNYGKKLPFEMTVEGRFSWGGAEICINAEHGTVTAVKVYSDAMDETLPRKLEQAILGRKLTASDMREADLPPAVREDILSLLLEAL